MKHRPRLGAIATALAVFGVGSLDLARAATTVMTSNGGNTITARAVAAPSDAVAAMTVNASPPLTCRVVVSWVPSPTAGIDGYEVARVVAGTGEIVAGPWFTSDTRFVDDPVPLALPVNPYEWRVRAVQGSWGSAWTAASPDTLANCLL